MSQVTDLSMGQLHNITQAAKIASALIRLHLSDLDGDPEQAEIARESLTSKYEDVLSLSQCCKHLANLNAYMINHGLDVVPQTASAGLIAPHLEGVGEADGNPMPVTSAEWEAAILNWAGGETTPAERVILGNQLVDLVDEQAQSCFAHKRELSNNYEFQIQRNSDHEDYNPNEPLLLAPGQGPM